MFGKYVEQAVWSTTEGLFDTSEKAMNVVGMSAGSGVGGTEETPANDHNGPQIPEGAHYGNIDLSTGEFTWFTEMPTTTNVGDIYMYGDYFYLNDGGCWSVMLLTDDSIFPLTGYITIPYEYANRNQETYSIILESINSEPITNISNRAFDGCTSLTSITLPESLTSIKAGAFNDCTSLESITIPDGVTTIDASAFSNCTSITSVTIPSSVTYIGGSAFYNCTSLESITLPERLTIIDHRAFDNCESLTDVYYAGTQEQWETLVANIGNYNEYLTGATIHYKYTSE